MDKDNNTKKLHRKKHVMSFVAAIALVILIISASVAWFVLQRSGIIDGFGTKVSEWDFIVSLESMGEPLQYDQSIDILANSIKTNEIGQGKLAPGSKGSIDLYVRNASDVATNYVLTIDNSKLRIDVDKSQSNYSSEELTKIFRSHFRFYADENYTREVSVDKPIEGDLVIGKEEKITIYWVWHYDGSFLCDEEMSDSERKQVMNKYDEEDVIISEHREYINGSVRIAVSGTQKEPQEKQ